MAPAPGTSKYFIAIIPPTPAYEAAQEWKIFFHSRFKTKAALKSPPHITLHMPFEWKTTKVDILLQSLSKFSRSCRPFEIAMQNFSCFPPRVIYIQVMENAMLADLQTRLTQFCKNELNLFNANRLDQPYHPHLTVAFRDLKKSMFPKAWSEVEHVGFNQLFTCNSLALLKHNGKQWEVRDTFSFP